MSGDPDLEQRYRRVLRLLPGYYRDKWEEDMVAAFLDSWLTGEPEDDEAILEFCKPTWQESASVVALAARLYLGGAGAPRRYFAWGQAVRGVVLALILMHAVRALDAFVRLAWARRLFGVPAAPAYAVIAPPSGTWTSVFYVVSYVWFVVFALLLFGHYRTARVMAAMAIVPDLVAVTQGQLNGSLQAPFSSWAFWVLLDLAPILAMAAFYRDVPQVRRRPWLLALPAGYLLVYVPVMMLQLTGNLAWLPDFCGTCCLLVALACLVHLPRARFRRSTGSSVWSLTLVLLAAVVGVYRLVSLGDYQHDPHLMTVSLAELLILVVAAVLVAPDAARAQSAMPASPLYPHPG
jgi:hypothetical protein